MLFVILTFFLTIIMGIPVSFCLGMAGIVFVLVTQKASLMAIPTLMFGGIDSFTLLAIPLFVMAGLLIEKAEVLPKLVDFADALVGHFSGGLAHVNIVSNMFFAGVSGVALADAAAIGSMLIPPMLRAGYDKNFAATISASASIVGPIIPPSVAMIIYATAAGGAVSVATLFLAGVLPGIALGLSMMAYTYVVSRRRGYPRAERRLSAKETISRAKGAVLGLMVPVIILGGILSGVFTPTEAGGIAVAYAILVGFLVTRKLTLRGLYESAYRTAIISATIFMMLASAKVMSWMLSVYQVPAKLAHVLMGVSSNPTVFIILVMLMLFMLGFVLEAVATMIMLVPCFAPIAMAYGIDPHHLGLLFVMTVQLALLTPPVALGLGLTCKIAGTSMEEAFIQDWLLIVILLGVMIVFATLPNFTLWLPRILGFIAG